jgi:hypothetical protein
MHHIADVVEGDDDTGETEVSGAMFQPRRLRTRHPTSVDAIPRKPSHLTS